MNEDGQGFMDHELDDVDWSFLDDLEQSHQRKKSKLSHVSDENVNKTQCISGLRTYFPHHKTGFKEGQEKVMRALLNGENAAAIFPTGGGKSLCYQLPGLMLAPEGLCLVVSPLISLMKDQVDVLRGLGHPADILGSTLSFEEKMDVKSRVKQRITSILYIAPEQLINETSMALIRSVPIALLAIDEAHCISEWGHAFRPDYLRLAQIRRELNVPRVVALTATATSQVQEDICNAFEIRRENCVRTSFFRPSLHLAFSPVTSEERDSKLVQALKSHPSGPTIVYVTRQKTAEDVAQMLKAAKFDARPYHAGMPNDKRQETQEWFMNSTAGIVSATIAFGMGIDKRDIRFIYHFNVPKSLQEYAQEVGRAGRDGKVALCTAFYCPDDIPDLESFAYCGSPSKKAIKQVLEEVFLQPNKKTYNVDTERGLSQYQMAKAYDMTETAVRMLLAFVEFYHNLLKQCTPRYCLYKVKPKDGSHPSQVLRILMADPPHAQQGSILRGHCQIMQKWAWIDVQEAASNNPNTSRESLIALLASLEIQGKLEIQASQVQHVYKIVAIPTDIEKLAGIEFQRFKQREKQELARLGEVLALFAAKDCHSKILTYHFEGATTPGHPSPFPCGTCQFCKTGTAISLPTTNGLSIDPNLWKFLVNDPSLPKDDPLLIARFALGFSSPRISRLKLNKHKNFGIFAGAKYRNILQIINDMFPALRPLM